MDKIGDYTVSQVVNKIKNKKGKNRIIPLNNNENFILNKLKRFNGNTKISTVLRKLRFIGSNNLFEDKQNKYNKYIKMIKLIKKLFSKKVSWVNKNQVREFNKNNNRRRLFN